MDRFGTFLASYMSLVMYYRRREWHGFWFSKLGHLKKFSKFVMVPLWRRKKFRHTKKSPRNGSVWHFSSKLDVPSNVLQKKRVARILVFKIRPSQEILKIRDGTPLEKKRVARILVFKIRPSQEILKIRDGREWHGFWVSKLGHLKKFSKFMMVPLWRRKKFRHTKKSPRNGSVWHFSSKLDVPSNVLQKKRVARILVFKIRPSQEILKIRDGTPLEAEEILTYRKKPSKWIEPSQEILKIRDEWHGFWVSKLGHLKKFSKFMMVPLWRRKKFRHTKKSPRNGSVWPSQEILKIRDGTPLE
ncbi:hypothetical protein OROGR_023065 [Orobanche gracilis]